MDNKNNIALISVIAKAWSDPKYKERLMGNPEQVLAEEGVRIQSLGRIRVIEQQADETVFLLPPRPEGELTISNITSRVLESSAMTGTGGDRILIVPDRKNT